MIPPYIEAWRSQFDELVTSDVGDQAKGCTCPDDAPSGKVRFALDCPIHQIVEVRGAKPS